MAITICSCERDQKSPTRSHLTNITDVNAGEIEGNPKGICDDVHDTAQSVQHSPPPAGQSGVSKAPEQAQVRAILSACLKYASLKHVNVPSRKVLHSKLLAF